MLFKKIKVIKDTHKKAENLIQNNRDEKDTKICTFGLDLGHEGRLG